MNKITLKKIWNEIKILLIAGLIAILFRSFFYEPFHIPSGSMKANLLVGDFIFVSKYQYGYSRYSFPFGIVPIKDRILPKAPQRGDVAVFKLPLNPSIHYIKRLIGVPGDEIQLKNSRLYLNGKLVPRQKIESFKEKINNQLFLADQYVETLPSGKSYKILEYAYDFPQDNTEVFIVPEGHYFFMGDNRDNSQDSRFKFEVGFVPFENIIGKANLIFASYDKDERNHGFFNNLMSFFAKFRFERLFKTIE